MSLSVTSNYAGSAAGELIGKALFSAPTLSGDNVTVYPGIKDEFSLPRLSLGDIITHDSCTFSDSGTITLDERTLDPCALKVNVEYCKTTLEQHWMAAKMKAGALNSDFPADLASYVIEYFSKQVAENIETIIWQGDDNSPSCVDGLISKAIADGTTQKIDNTTLSAANIITELNKVYNKMAATPIDFSKARIFLNRKAVAFYRQAIAAGTGNGGAYYIGTQDLNFLGVPLIETAGMEDDYMYATTVDNIALGTDLLSDFNEVKVIDMSETTGDDNVRFKMRFKVDVNHVWGNIVVVYYAQ